MRSMFKFKFIQLFLDQILLEQSVGNVFVDGEPATFNNYWKFKKDDVSSNVFKFKKKKKPKII